MTRFVVGFEKLSSYPRKGYHKFSKKICISKLVRVDTHMTSTSRKRGDGRGVGEGKNEKLLDVGGWRVTECSGRPIFILFY